VASGQCPGAEVDAQLVDLAVVLAVGDDRDRKFDSPRLTVQFGLGGERPDQRVRLAAIKPSK
jgi:hypothetical protein